MLLRRWPASAAHSPPAAFRGAGGRSPAGGRGAHQGGRRDPGARGAGAGGRVPLDSGTPDDGVAPPLGPPQASARPRGPAGGARSGPAALLAGCRSRKLRELRAGHLLVPALAGDRHAHPPPRLGRARPDGELPRLGAVLVRRAPGADRRLARPEETPRLSPAPRRARTPRRGLALRHDQPEAGLRRDDDLEPLPAPGLGAAAGALRPRPARSFAAGEMAAAGFETLGLPVIDQRLENPVLIAVRVSTRAVEQNRKGVGLPRDAPGVAGQSGDAGEGACLGEDVAEIGRGRQAPLPRLVVFS